MRRVALLLQPLRLVLGFAGTAAAPRHRGRSSGHDLPVLRPRCWLSSAATP